MIFGKLDPNHTWSGSDYDTENNSQWIILLKEPADVVPEAYSVTAVGAVWTEKSDLISVWSVCFKDLMGEKQSDWPAV